MTLFLHLYVLLTSIRQDYVIKLPDYGQTMLELQVIRSDNIPSNSRSIIVFYDVTNVDILCDWKSKSDKFCMDFIFYKMHQQITNKKELSEFVLNVCVIINYLNEQVYFMTVGDTYKEIYLYFYTIYGFLHSMLLYENLANDLKIILNRIIPFQHTRNHKYLLPLYVFMISPKNFYDLSNLTFAHNLCFGDKSNIERDSRKEIIIKMYDESRNIIIFLNYKEYSEEFNNLFDVFGSLIKIINGKEILKNDKLWNIVSEIVEETCDKKDTNKNK